MEPTNTTSASASAPPAQTRTLYFDLDKVTKNTVRYKERVPHGQTAVLAQVYVNKDYAGNAKTVEVTIKMG